MTRLIDSHTHLEAFHRKGLLDEILGRAAGAGVGGMVTIGTDPSDWETYRGLAEAYPGIIAYTAGIHPCDVDAKWPAHLELLAACLETARPRPVALGEVGLDRFHLSRDPAQAEAEIAMQKDAFRAQLQIAASLRIPVVVHSRGAFDECISLVDESGVDWRVVVFHCFTEGANSMAALLERGGRGSFTGVLTYKNAVEVREAAICQGLDRLMIETDAPYLTPMPHRGKPNEPAYLAHTAEFASELLGVSMEELAARTAETTRDFYGLRDWE